MTRRCDSTRLLIGGDLITAATAHSDAVEKWTTLMGTENAALLAEVIACKHIVDDYTKRLDEACAEYYSTGKRNTQIYRERKMRISGTTVNFL